MVPRTRRSLLGGGLALAAALAGCTSGSVPDDGTATPDDDTETTTARTTRRSRSTTGTTGTAGSGSTATGSTTRTTRAADPSVLSPGASVVSQATAEQPAILELALRNDGDEAVPVNAGGEGGSPMEYLPAPETGLVVFPVDPEHVFLYDSSLPTSRTRGCWRVPDDAAVAVENLGFPVTLAPGERYAIRHRLYWDGPDGTCFTAGTYGLTAKLVLAEQMEHGPSFDLEYALAVDDAGDVSISVEGPVSA